MRVHHLDEDNPWESSPSGKSQAMKQPLLCGAFFINCRNLFDELGARNDLF